MSEPERCDVLILGTGLGGTMLASCLAARGLSVTLLDAAVHPRFAIGEATTPDTSFRMKLLGLKHGVPEIANLGAFYDLRDTVGPSTGIKRAFSFQYHRAGEQPTLREAHQYCTLAPPLGPDCHLFRQDTDAYMLAVAASHGATVHQRTRVAEIDLRDDGVGVSCEGGRRFEARFLVDGAGFRSPLVRQLELRRDPCPLRTNSRSIFTHMVGVPPYDALVPPVGAAGLQYPLSQSTLHHVFPGGWMWVIPFDNHHDRVNHLCSVGLMLDREIYPETGLPAEEEFFQLIAPFPGIAAQFQTARSIRPWVSTGRIQYLSKQVVGDRWALLAHAAGFVDPLYSSGLNITAGMVDLLASGILEACASDRFEREALLPVERFVFDNVDLYDRVVAHSYRAFAEFDLWDAWLRPWVIGVLVGSLMNGDLYLRWHQGQAEQVRAQSNDAPYTTLLGRAEPHCRAFWDQAFAHMDRLAGDAPPPAAEVAAAVRELCRTDPCSPNYWDWHDTHVRATPNFTLWGMTRLYLSYWRDAPRELFERLFGWSPLRTYAYLYRRVREQKRSTRERARRYGREVFSANSAAWPRPRPLRSAREVQAEPEAVAQ